MSRWDDKRYDVASVLFFTSCVTSLFMPIICMLHYLCIEGAFKRGCDSKGYSTGGMDPFLELS